MTASSPQGICFLSTLPPSADMTPCMSPLPHEGLLQDKPSLALIQEEAEAQGVKSILGKGRITTEVAKWRTESIWFNMFGVPHQCDCFNK